ncbi:Xanthine and CO dehydrogenase maturation factor, XdhC/CoxF family [Hymenobacter gelipurpurascens]|uniref:Xanthine and CO dehydrogenase maturation factor, XdhC/CoxF family n=1 Tax=Hymenobacter gelipurpurascens TaxID=89968 RepID=A0A212TGR2_9BACT|nr:XdhC/CoxI family protein [Hymenobacter gelipurpurascens]SNC65193.1 Xanthine and CO dehydrogenase maturation factor, XdhC/CoxF family [Hymenobacter gelipurpurascens]
MTELQRLLLAYDQHRADARPCALATVVEVLGSAYRRPGARMLVTEDGELTGAISGGCLEGDARQRARQAIFRGHPALVTYDTRDEDDPRHGLGPGCQGVVRILLEPLDFAASDNPVEILREFAQHPEPAVLATVFETDASGLRAAVGQRLLLSAAGVVRGTALLAVPLAEAARVALAQSRSQVLDIDTDAGPVRALLEILTPPLRVVVYGAGNDAQPLVRLGASLGWHITVVDGRPNLATAARFPEAAAVQVVSVRELEVQRPDADAYHVLLSHNYAYDLAALQTLVFFPAPYIGLLGPRLKAQRLLEELGTAPAAAVEALRERLRSPIGLDLGSETPEEIALCIVAEIQAHRSGRQGQPLRERAGTVHEPA